MTIETTEAPSPRSVPDEHPKQVPRISLPSLRLRVSERRLLLFLLDVSLLNGALLAALIARIDFAVSPDTIWAFFKWFVTLSLVWLLSALFFDCYDLARAASTWHSLRSSGPAALTTVLVYTFTPFLTPPLQSRSLIFLFAGLAVGAIALWRVAYAQLFVQPWFKQRALVVGAGNAGRYLANILQTAPDSANPYEGTGYRLIGFVDDDAELNDTTVEGVPVLGSSDALVSLALELKVDEVILAITHRHAIAEQLFDALLQCRELGLRVTTMSALHERLLGRVPVEHIGRDLPMVVPMEETPAERLYGLFKRCCDLVTGLIGLLAFGLLAPLVALANALTSPGPLLYRQQRVGRGGRPFGMLKFRSMVPDAEAGTGAVWAEANDQRITPVGKLLRRTRLDELPQFINVLRGEMSLIGPRPERPEFVEELAGQVPFYRARHAVRPGITGWAQVQFTYGNSVDAARVKLEYDLYYVRHASLLLDMRIFLLTIPVMLKFQGC